MAKAHANGRNKSRHCKANNVVVVGACCVVHANERNNCQHCWRLSNEAMHPGTVILKKIAMRMHGRFHEANIVVLRFADHKTIEMLGLVAPKV